MKLYSYYRSSASYRVRIALNLKEVEYELETINLARGEQHQPHFQEINGAALLPVLELPNGQRISQSAAIIDYLEQQIPSPSLLNNYTGSERSTIQQIVNIIACDIHPLNNLRVLNYLNSAFSASDAQKNQWYRHWIHKGFSAVEALLKSAPYAVGKHISMADIYLVPQLFNARRFEVDIAPYPNIQSVCSACDQLHAFKDAHPENQPDAK